MIVAVAVEAQVRGARRAADDVLHRPDTAGGGLARYLDLRHVAVMNRDQGFDRGSDHGHHGLPAAVDVGFRFRNRWLPDTGERIAYAVHGAQVEHRVRREDSRKT